MQPSKELREQWWVDYVEGELDGDDRKMADLLLEHSAVDREIVANLRRVRKMVAHSEFQAQPDGNFFASLKEKIITAAKEVEMESPLQDNHGPWYNPRHFRSDLP